MSKKRRCLICGENKAIIDEHHVWPQAAGGEAGPVVDLCSTCHSGIHRQALNLISKKAVRKQYFPPGQMERAAPLIRYVVLALRETQEGRTPKRKSQLVIETDSELMTVLHMLKADAGVTNLGKFCEMVLRRYALSKL